MSKLESIIEKVVLELLSNEEVLDTLTESIIKRITMIEPTIPEEKSLLQETIRKHVVEVTFTKRDGSTRVLVGTLKAEYLPEVDGYNTPANPKPGLIMIYDLENDGFRSFYADSVISYKVLS